MIDPGRDKVLEHVEGHSAIFEHDAVKFAYVEAVAQFTAGAVVKRSLDVSEEEAFDLQGDALIEVLTSPDAREGPRAFAEKREPNWSSE